MNKAIINMPTGPIEICTVFDFIPKVKKEFLPSHYEQVAVDLRNSYSHNIYDPYGRGQAIVESKHKLTTNPMKLLTELKKTASPIFVARQIDLDDLLYETTSRSAREMGQPTHFFPIGEDVYALVSQEDCVLFQTASFKQQLVCTKKNRNFIIHAKNLNVDLSRKERFK